MQNYCGNSSDYMRRGNPGRAGRMNNCQPVVSTPSCVYEKPCTPVESIDALAGLPIAMAYVPWQTWKDVMCPEKALCAGTIFEELYKPFLGMGGCR